MAAYSPQAITAAWTTIKAAIPGARLGGIYAPKPGYHNGRHHVSMRDYSVQRADDKVGDGNAASALDITLSDAQMKTCTQRLINATLASPQDPRMFPVREFFGTVNGRTVTGLDVRDRRWVTSDPSHLWHIHISGYRRWCNDYAAWQGIASVVIGGGAKPPPPGGDWFDMATQAQLEASIRKVLDPYLGNQVMGQPFPMRTRRMANRILALLPQGDPEKSGADGPNRNELFDAWSKRVGIPDIVARLDRIEKKIK